MLNRGNIDVQPELRQSSLSNDKEDCQRNKHQESLMLILVGGRPTCFIKELLDRIWIMEPYS